MCLFKFLNLKLYCPTFLLRRSSFFSSLTSIQPTSHRALSLYRATTRNKGIMPRSKSSAETTVSPPSKSSDKLTAKVKEKVATAFTEAQRTCASHPRASKLLQNAYATAPAPFVSEFTHALNRILLVFSRDANIERLVLFVAKFASHTHDSGNFCSLVLMYLLSHTNATGRAIRFRTVQLVASVLHHLPEDTELADEVWAPLHDAVISRSFDKVPRVRAAAAGALCRLQTGEADDPFCERLVEMLSRDSSAAVRKAALQTVAVTEHTLAAVAGRTRDVNVEVRKAAYETLAGKVNPFELHASERVALLARGLGERVASVREVVETKLLLDGWLDGACEGNVFHLVDLLGCQEYEGDVLRALRVVFNSQKFEGLVEVIEIDVNNLTHTDVLLLRAVSDSKKGDEAIEKFLPSALLYAEVLKYYAVNDFASRHLLELCRSVDMSDEAGRKVVENVVREDFLASSNISEETVRSGVRAMKRVVMDEESTSRLMFDIVREVLKVDEDSEEQERNQSEEEKSWREIRALSISLEILRVSRQGATSGSVVNSICLSIAELAVLPQLMCEDEDKRRTALECLGLFCLMDKSGAEAETKMPLFIQAARTDLPSIQELALKVLVDFLMVFDFTDEAARIGGKCASTPKQNEMEIPDQRDSPDFERRSSFTSTAEECISILSQNITSGDRVMRTIAVEGLARLLSVRRIAPNGALLSRLLIVHHNPVTEDDDGLRQCLSVFFPSFSFSSPQNRLALEDAFRPTCRIISSAPHTSPLSTISLVQVAQFVLHLTNPTNVPEKRGQTNGDVVGRSADLVHERLAEVVLNEIIDAVQGEEVGLYRNFSKILSNFRFSWSVGNNTQLELLKKLARAAVGETNDKRLKTVLNKFMERVQKLLADNEATLEASTSAEEYCEEQQGEEETVHRPSHNNIEKETGTQADGPLAAGRSSGEGGENGTGEDANAEDDEDDTQTTVDLCETAESVNSDEDLGTSNVAALPSKDLELEEKTKTKYPVRSRRRVRNSETSQIIEEIWGEH